MFVGRGWMLPGSVAMGDFDLVRSAPSAHQKSFAHQPRLAVVSTMIDVADWRNIVLLLGY
jgi:hypothetical protein